MFLKTLKQISVIAATSFAITTQAATIQLDGTITSCAGLCLVLSANGNAVTATYDDTFQAAPSISIEGQASTLGFTNSMYAPDVTVFPAPFGALAGIPTPKAGVGPVASFDGSTSVDISTTPGQQVTVFGIGSTSGAPIWGIFDLVNNSFDAYLFTTDMDGISSNGLTAGILPLASGTFTATTVPVPAAAWLFLSAFGGLLSLKKARFNQ